jgi:hypothetical protein
MNMCKGKYIAGLVVYLFVIQTGFSQTVAKPVTATAGAQASKTTEFPFQGKYDLFSGIPTVYIGHIVIMKDGKYKVAFGTDETAYENGTYKYNSATDSIEWLTGLFQRKEWKGKLVKKAGGYRIEFNKTTFAETD